MNADLIDETALRKRATAIVAAACKAGADSADALAVQGVSISTSVLNGTVESANQNEAVDIGLRVFVGKRSAIVSTTSLDTRDYDDLVGRAVAMAKLAPENPYAGIDDNPSRAGANALDLIDRETPADPESLAARAREAEKAALSVKGVTRSGGASASWSASAVALATSAGFTESFAGTRHSHSATAIAGDGNILERDFDYSSGRHFADLDPAEEIGRRAGERTVQRIGARKIPSMSVPVIFDRRVAGSLIGHLLGAINGAGIARRSSFLSDRMDSKIADAALTVTDDPFKRRGAASRPFDGEGRGDGALTLVEGGVLKSWLLDLASARELGLESNGRAARGTSGHPSPAPSNVMVTPGALSPEDLIRETGAGLLVTQMMGRGANLVNGDYSRGASGFWIEGGEIAYPVNEITIAGNLGAMLLAIRPASDIDPRDTIACPTLAAGEMTIAGA